MNRKFEVIYKTNKNDFMPYFHIFVDDILSPIKVSAEIIADMLRTYHNDFNVVINELSNIVIQELIILFHITENEMKEYKKVLNDTFNVYIQI